MIKSTSPLDNYFVLTTFTATAYSKWLVQCDRQRALMTIKNHQHVTIVVTVKPERPPAISSLRMARSRRKRMETIAKERREEFVASAGRTQMCLLSPVFASPSICQLSKKFLQKLVAQWRNYVLVFIQAQLALRLLQRNNSIVLSSPLQFEFVPSMIRLSTI